MHAIAHLGCANTVRESAQKVNFGREKKSLAAGEIEPESVLTSSLTHETE